MIDVTVRFHAGARETAGVPEIRLSLEDVNTVAELKERLLVQLPNLARYRNSLLFAVREDYVTADSRLAAGDVVSCFPPVSGG